MYGRHQPANILTFCTLTNSTDDLIALLNFSFVFFSFKLKLRKCRFMKPKENSTPSPANSQYYFGEVSILRVGSPCSLSWAKRCSIADFSLAKSEQLNIIVINESSLPEDLEQAFWLVHPPFLLYTQFVGKFNTI